MIPGLTPEEERDLLLSVGTRKARRRLSPLEVATLLDRGRGAGATIGELSEACHLETSTQIGRFLRLLALNPALHHLVDWGRPAGGLSMTQAQEIARIEDLNAQLIVAEATIRHGLTGAEVRDVVQRYQRSGLGAEEAVGAIIDLRPEVVRRHLLLAAVPEDLHEFLSTLGQERRNVLMAELVSDLGLSAVGRLDAGRFTMLFDQGVEPPPVGELERSVGERLRGRAEQRG